jgi:hypothetical protein
MRATTVLTFLSVLSACGGSTPPEPSDVDLAPARAGFHCGEAQADTAACNVLDGFAHAGAISDWPTGTDVQVWLGVDHCVSPTAGPGYAAYQLVYLRSGEGSPPLGTIAPARVLPYAGVFGSSQLDTSAMPGAAAALAAIAQGQPPDPSTTSELWRTIPESGEGAYRRLVRTLSGVSVGDGDATTGIWFLRGDATRLFLVGPTVQGGCASELHRVPR